MLVPVIVRASYKIPVTLTVTLESVLGSNLPLLFPEVEIMNRTPTACSVTVSGETRNLFVNQPDPDFDGAVLSPLSATFSVGEGLTASVSGLGNTLLPTANGITTELTLVNTGPAAEARVSLVIRGLIESAVSPDPLVTINV